MKFYVPFLALALLGLSQTACNQNTPAATPLSYQFSNYADLQAQLKKLNINLVYDQSNSNSCVDQEVMCMLGGYYQTGGTYTNCVGFNDLTAAAQKTLMTKLSTITEIDLNAPVASQTSTGTAVILSLNVNGTYVGQKALYDNRQSSGAITPGTIALSGNKIVVTTYYNMNNQSVTNYTATDLNTYGQVGTTQGTNDPAFIAGLKNGTITYQGVTQPAGISCNANSYNITGSLVDLFGL